MLISGGRNPGISFTLISTSILKLGIISILSCTEVMFTGITIDVLVILEDIRSSIKCSRKDFFTGHL